MERLPQKMLRIKKMLANEDRFFKEWASKRCCENIKITTSVKINDKELNEEKYQCGYFVNRGIGNYFKCSVFNCPRIGTGIIK